MFTLIPYFSNFLRTVALPHNSYYHPRGHCPKAVNNGLITAVVGYSCYTDELKLLYVLLGSEISGGSYFFMFLCYSNSSC